MIKEDWIEKANNAPGESLATIAWLLAQAPVEVQDSAEYAMLCCHYEQRRTARAEGRADPWDLVPVARWVIAR